MAMVMVSLQLFRLVLRDTDEVVWCRARIRTILSISRALLGELCISLLVRIECCMLYVNY